MVGGVLADHIDDGRIRAACVMEIGKAVGKAWSQVQQRTGRFAGHPGVAVCCAGYAALEQPQDATDPRLLVQSCDEVHL